MLGYTDRINKFAYLDWNQRAVVFKGGAVISHRHQCIFIHIPKCAGTSIESVLGHLDGHDDRGGQDHRTIRMLEKPVLTKNVLSGENFREFIWRWRYKYRKAENPRNKLEVTKSQYKSYYKFTFVRNPWARAYSWYKNVMRDETHKRKLNIYHELSFKAFLSENIGKGMLRPQLYWLKDFSGSIPLDYIGKFESLNDDFCAVCDAIGLSDIELPHLIRGDGGYQQHYDNETRRIVADYYREEIAIFNYSF